jgi:hypothetical protein
MTMPSFTPSTAEQTTVDNTPTQSGPPEGTAAWWFQTNQATIQAPSHIPESRDGLTHTKAKVWGIRKRLREINDTFPTLAAGYEAPDSSNLEEGVDDLHIRQVFVVVLSEILKG